MGPQVPVADIFQEGHGGVRGGLRDVQRHRRGGHPSLQRPEVGRAQGSVQPGSNR